MLPITWAVKSERQRIRDILSRAAADFERNGLSRSAIRQCESEAHDYFLREGLHVLLESDDSAGYRFISVLLLRDQSLAVELTNRWHFSKNEAVYIAKRLLRVDLNFDIHLTGLLPDRNEMLPPFGLGGEHAERALEILDEISPGRRIIPMMRHLTDHPDSKISSKAALLVGKRIQNLSWARRVITDTTDARLRANAIEAFWGVKTPQVIEFFRDCLSDYDNRVVGNAIIGLHQAGDPETRSLVAGIASDGNPKLRMTAAWAMGQIGDASFVPVLAPLAKDEHAEVRRAALRSLRNFHIEEKKTREAAAAARLAEAEEAALAPGADEMDTVPSEPARSGSIRQFWT